MHNPKEVHLEAVSQIPHYLKNSVGRVLLFKKDEKLNLVVYTNVDYASSIDDRKSTSGYCTFLGGNLVTWSKKQNVVVRSSLVAEIRAMALGICELLPNKNYPGRLKFSMGRNYEIYGDNKSVNSIAHKSNST